MSDNVERRDAPAGRVALLMAGLVGALLFVCAAVAGMEMLFDSAAPSPGAPAPDALRPPAPRLQVVEARQRIALERVTAAALRPGPGRIGIDAAMARVAHEGWPAGGSARR